MRNYTIEQKLLPLGRQTNRPGTKIQVKELVSHRTGNPDRGADALAHYRYFAGAYRGRSAHYFVDSERILQLIPDDEMAWHAEDPQRIPPNPNLFAIGIELCENFPMGTPEMGRAYEKYVWLHAYLCRQHGLDPRHHIKGHFEYDPKNRADDPVGLFGWQPFIADVAAWWGWLQGQTEPSERIRQLEVENATLREKIAQALAVLGGKSVAS